MFLGRASILLSSALAFGCNSVPVHSGATHSTPSPVVAVPYPPTHEDVEPWAGDCGNRAVAMERFSLTVRPELANAQVVMTVRRWETEVDDKPLTLRPEEVAALQQFLSDPTNYSDCPGVIAAVCDDVEFHVVSSEGTSTFYYCQAVYRLIAGQSSGLNIPLSSRGIKRWQDFLRNLLKDRDAHSA